MKCCTNHHNGTAVLSVDEDIHLGEMDEYHLNVSDIIPVGKVFTTYMVTFVFVAIFVIGVCGNLMLIFTVIRNLTMQSPQNIYLATMGFADFLVAVISVPFAATVYITSTWPFGLVLCKFNAMLHDISIGVSIFTLLVLSLDRYTAIVTPFKLHNKKSSRGCSVAIRLKVTAIWLLSIAFSVPDGLFTALQVTMVGPDDVTYHACTPYPDFLGDTYHTILVLSKFCVFFVVPVFLITIVYTLMAIQLMASSRFFPVGGPGNQQQLFKQMKTRRSLAKLFLVMVLLFVICFLPKHIFLIWFYLDKNSRSDYNLGWHIFKIISHCLAYVNSCINPVTLYFLSEVFRRYFNWYLTWIFCFWKHKAADDERREWLRRNSAPLTSIPEMSGFNVDDRRKSGNASFRINTKSVPRLSP